MLRLLNYLSVYTIWDDQGVQYKLIFRTWIVCMGDIKGSKSCFFQQQTRWVNYKEVIKRSLQTYYSQFYSDSVMAPFGDATVKIAGYRFGKKPNMSSLRY